MSDITRSEAIKQLRILKADINNELAFVSKTKYKHKALESLDMAIKSVEKLDKITDMTEGTIDHFDLEDAMDLLYDIKGVVEHE